MGRTLIFKDNILLEHSLIYIYENRICLQKILDDPIFRLSSKIDKPYHSDKFSRDEKCFKPIWTPLDPQITPKKEKKSQF